MVPFIITIIVILLIVATSVAMWWWRISAKIAPYADELDKERSRSRPMSDEHVVVIGGARKQE